MIPSKGDKRGLQQLQSKVLDTVTTAIVCGAIYYYPQWFNPWNLTTIQWMGGGLLIRGAITFYDHLVVLLIPQLALLARGYYSSTNKTPKEELLLLPTRQSSQKAVRYVTLDTTSFVYLTINSFHEWVFVQNLCHYIWHADNVPKLPSEIGLFNTVGALYIMFIVLDVCYAPLHHILHMPALYPLIHKHHHRQHFPTRGYLDAGNEHPIEHFVGVCCTWAAVLTAVHTTGAHFVTAFFFFNIHAALAMLNHSPYDIEWTVLGIHYSVGNHEMHHRKFTYNYAQYCLWYDYIMKTYIPYEGPNSSSSTAAVTAADENKRKDQ